MHSAVLLASLLFASEPEARVTISDVVMDRSPDAATITGFDPTGEVAAEIVIWASTDGLAHVDAAFADGSDLAIVVDGDRRLRSVDSNDPWGASAQTAMVFGVLAQLDPQEGALMCGASIIAAGIAIAGANAPAAFVAGVSIGCSCVPLITGKEIPEC